MPEVNATWTMDLRLRSRAIGQTKHRKADSGGLGAKLLDAGVGGRRRIVEIFIIAGREFHVGGR